MGKGILISVGNTNRIQTAEEAGPSLRIQGKDVTNASSRGLDIVFVIDTTGSMSDKIEGLIATSKRFVDELARLALSHRTSVVAFGDLTVPGDDIVAFPFTNDIKITKDTLSKVPRYAGGGNSGESSLEALDKACALPFRPHVVKAIVLITDEPALQDRINAREISKRLRQKEVLTFVVSPPEPYFQSMAKETGGLWFRIAADTDFTAVLDMFKSLAARLSTVVADVYRIGNGSVSSYLQITAPEKRRQE